MIREKKEKWTRLITQWYPIDGIRNRGKLRDGRIITQENSGSSMNRMDRMEIFCEGLCRKTNCTSKTTVCCYNVL